MTGENWLELFPSCEYGPPMPWTYRYDAKSDAFFGTATGILTDEELMTRMAKALCDSNYHPDVRMFGDYAHVDEFRVSAQTFDRLVAHEKVTGMRGRHAVLLFSPKGASDFIANIRRITSGRIRDFSSRREALNWLNDGVTPDKMISVEDTLPPQGRA